MIEKECGNTIDICVREARIKYKKAVEGMKANIKSNINGCKVIVQCHITIVIQLGAFDYKSNEEFKRILVT
jgi:hypothetical protein